MLQQLYILFWLTTDGSSFSVGTGTGEIMIWELGGRERISHRSFKVWDLGQCSVALQVCVKLY